jgi:hypothetical protein
MAMACTMLRDEGRAGRGKWASVSFVGNVRGLYSCGFPMIGSALGGVMCSDEGISNKTRNLLSDSLPWISVLAKC